MIFQILVLALLGFILLRSFQMTAAIDKLTQAVAETTALETSAIALITGIAGQLRDAAGDEAAVNALADQLEQGATGLAAAVTANTPAAAPADTGGAAAGEGAATAGAGDAGAGAGAGDGGGEPTT